MSRAWVDVSLPLGLAATACVVLLAQGARVTPAFALLVLCAGLCGAVVMGLWHSARAFCGQAAADETTTNLDARHRDELSREKMLLLKSLKELDFDHAMGKVSDRDHDEMAERLRARAVRLMKELDERPDYRSRIEHELESRLGRAAEAAPRCAACGATNDADATFCKRCGQRLYTA
jgi:hypothetical protein